MMVRAVRAAEGGRRGFTSVCLDGLGLYTVILCLLPPRPAADYSVSAARPDIYLTLTPFSFCLHAVCHCTVLITRVRASSAISRVSTVYKPSPRNLNGACQTLKHRLLLRSHKEIAGFQIKVTGTLEDLTVFRSSLKSRSRDRTVHRLVARFKWLVKLRVRGGRGVKSLTETVGLCSKTKSTPKRAYSTKKHTALPSMLHPTKGYLFFQSCSFRIKIKKKKKMRKACANGGKGAGLGYAHPLTNS